VIEGIIMSEPIGSIQAILSSISTSKENSCKITFEVNPENVSAVNKLMERYLVGEVLYELQLNAHSDDNNELTNG
jgi:hypothetical protein